MGAPFRQIEMQRVIRAFRKEGLPPPQFELVDGRLRILPAGAAQSQDSGLDAEIRGLMGDGRDPA